MIIDVCCLSDVPAAQSVLVLNVEDQNKNISDPDCLIRLMFYWYSKVNSLYSDKTLSTFCVYLSAYILCYDSLHWVFSQEKLDLVSGDKYISGAEQSPNTCFLFCAQKPKKKGRLTWFSTEKSKEKKKHLTLHVGIFIFILNNRLKVILRTFHAIQEKTSLRCFPKPVNRVSSNFSVFYSFLSKVLSERNRLQSAVCCP